MKTNTKIPFFKGMTGGGLGSWLTTRNDMKRRDCFVPRNDVLVSGDDRE